MIFARRRLASRPYRAFCLAVPRVGKLWDVAVDDYVRAKRVGWQDPDGDDGNFPLDPIVVEGRYSTHEVDSFGLTYTQHLVGAYSVDPATIEPLD